MVTAARAHGTGKSDVIVVARASGAHVDGGGGNDWICGSKGRDTLIGGAGADHLKGESGADTLIASSGKGDVLIGGKGEDSFMTGKTTKTDAKLGERINGRRKLAATKLRRSTEDVDPSSVLDVSPSSRGETVVLLKRGAGRLSVGKPLVIPVSAKVPHGVLGVITASRQLTGRRQEVAVRPATLDEAYSSFKIHLEGETLAELAGAAETASARASAASSALFKCTGSGSSPSVTVVHDFSGLKPEFSLDISKPEIFFLLTGSPKLGVNVGTSGSASCTYEGGPVFNIPVADTPVLITIKPAMSVNTSADLNTSFTWSPRLTLGMQEAPGVNSSVHVFNAGTTNASFSGNGSASMFLGASIGISVAGRVGLEGKAGPKVDAQVNAGDQGACFDASASLHADLNAYADIFVKHWSFTIAKGDFETRPLIHTCTSPPSPPTPPPPPEPEPEPEELQEERAAIYWNTDYSDVDLHIWDSEGHHAWYGDHEGIPGAYLSEDITTGYGPEIFYDEMPWLHRTFTYALCYFSDHEAGPSLVESDLIDPNGTEHWAENWLFEDKDYVLLGSSPPGAAFYPEDHTEWC